jgi:hypothetical protein
MNIMDVMFVMVKFEALPPVFPVCPAVGLRPNVLSHMYNIKPVNAMDVMFLMIKS